MPIHGTPEPVPEGWGRLGSTPVRCNKEGGRLNLPPPEDLPRDPARTHPRWSRGGRETRCPPERREVRRPEAVTPRAVRSLEVGSVDTHSDPIRLWPLYPWNPPSSVPVSGQDVWSTNTLPCPPRRAALPPDPPPPHWCPWRDCGVQCRVWSTSHTTETSPYGSRSATQGAGTGEGRTVTPSRTLEGERETCSGR